MTTKNRAIGWIDPSVRPDTLRGRQVLAEIRRKGLSLHRLHLDHTRAVRVTGPGIHVVAASFESLTLADLNPNA